MTRLRARQPVFDSQQGREGIFLFAATSRPTLGATQTSIQNLPGPLFQWVKRPGREANLTSI